MDAVSAEFGAPVCPVLLAPNGAGKTTTMNVISGFIQSSGNMSYKHENIRNLAPLQRTRTSKRENIDRTLKVTGLSDRSYTLDRPGIECLRTAVNRYCTVFGREVENNPGG